MSVNSPFKRIEPNKTVEVHLTDGNVLQGPRGATIGEFLSSMNGGPPSQISNDNGSPISPPTIGAVVNGQLRELTYKINIESEVKTPEIFHETTDSSLNLETWTIVVSYKSKEMKLLNEEFLDLTNFQNSKEIGRAHV